MASLFFWKPKIIPYFQETNLLFPASLLLYHEIKSPVCSVASHHIGQIGDSSLISYFIFITIYPRSFIASCLLPEYLQDVSVLPRRSTVNR